MSIEHSKRSVIMNIICCGHQASAIAHQMWHCHNAGAHIKN
jgi:hypothetical protein